MAIATDNPQGSALGTNGAPPSATFTYSYTVSSGLSNSILVVSPYTETGSNTAVTGITYNGVALTKAGSSGAVVTYYRSVDLWYLLNPPAGTADIVVTWAATVSNSSLNAVTLTGAKQQAPSVEATVVTGNTTSSPEVISITTATNGALVLGACCANLEVAFTMPVGTLLKSTLASDGGGGGSAGCIGYAIKSPAGSQSLSFDQTGSAAMVAIIAAFAPADAVTTVSPGLGVLNISGFAPTLTFTQSVSPGLGQLVITGYAPGIASTGGLTLTPGRGTLVLTGYAPSVQFGRRDDDLIPIIQNMDIMRKQLNAILYALQRAQPYFGDDFPHDAIEGQLFAQSGTLYQLQAGIWVALT